MARWITVRLPFDFHWPSRAVTAFGPENLAEHFVKDELADFAVENGYATEGKVDEAARSTKGTTKKAKTAGKAAANRGSDDAMARPDMADHDQSAGGDQLDPDSR